MNQKPVPPIICHMEEGSAEFLAEQTAAFHAACIREAVSGLPYTDEQKYFLIGELIALLTEQEKARLIPLVWNQPG